VEARSPVSPIPGVVRPVEPRVFGRQELVPSAAPELAASAHARKRGDRAAAAALTLAALGTAADIVIRPILSPDILPHPAVQWGAVAALVGTAIGVRRGWRPARRVARGLGYVAGAGAFYALSHFASFGSPAEWWVAGLWSVEAISLGHVLQRLGWTGDEE
jgi:hypothetical protein